MNIKKLVGCCVALAVVGFAWANEPAETATVKTSEEEVELTEETDNPLTFEVSADFLSDSVWRGWISNDNPVIQPSFTIDYETEDWGGFYANIWSSFDMTHKEGTSTKSRRDCGWYEVDYTVAYYTTLLGLDWEMGHTWYTYPNNNGHSEREVFATVAYKNPILTPSASVYWMYHNESGEDDCLYYNLTLEHEFSFGEEHPLTITPYASLGFGGNTWLQYMLEDHETRYHTEMIDQNIGVKASIALTENLSFGVQCAYTWLPSGTVRHSGYMDDTKDHIFYGGANLTLSF